MLRKIIWHARSWAAVPFIALGWISFGLAMLIEPKRPRP